MKGSNKKEVKISVSHISIFAIPPPHLPTLFPIINLLLYFTGCIALQEWTSQPRYQEVNPHGSVVMPCVISSKKGECRWERDGNPVGMYPTKYEWAGSPEKGDCSIKILDANLEYDDGVWQCQVTPTSFLFKDSLISEGAELVVRGKQTFLQLWFYLS